MEILKKYLVKYLLIWLLLACIVAFYWPQIAAKAGGALDRIHPFDLNGQSMQILIAVTMLILGSLLPIEEIKMVARRWPTIIGGTCIQFISMPLLAYIGGKMFHLEGPWFFGIMMAGCVPGAMASNMLTLISRGNISYSVGLTTSGTMLSPFLVPVLLAFFLGTEVKQDVTQMIQTLLLTVVCPVVFGFTMSRLFKFWNNLATLLGEILGNLVIIWIISSVVAGSRDTLRQFLEQFPLNLIGALLVLNIGGYLSGWYGGLLIGADNRMRRALTLEVGMQNAGLGTMLAMKYGPHGSALVCAMYTFGCMFTGIILAQIFRRMKTPDSE